MKRVCRWASVALASVGAATSLAAQASSPSREGFYASLGLGYGWEVDNCTGPSFSGGCGGSTGGLSGYLALGGTLSPSWRLGFESNGWTKSKNGATQTTSFLNAMASFYPSMHGNFWLKFGGAYVTSTVSSSFGGGAHETGIGGSIGLGWDWHPGHGTFAIIPYAGYHYQFTGGTLSSDHSSTVKARLLQIGVGFGYKH